MLLVKPTNAAGWPSVASVVSHAWISSYAATCALAWFTRNVEARSGRIRPGGQAGTTLGMARNWVSTGGNGSLMVAQLSTWSPYFHAK